MSDNTTKTGSRHENKWICAAIPALLLHCSIGTVYCWGTFSKEIGEYIYGAENYQAHSSAVQWAFSLAIFFLGMSAAFLGDVVEKDILQIISDRHRMLHTRNGRNGSSHFA